MRIAVKAVQIALGGGLTHLNKIIEWFGKLAPDTEFLLLGKEGQEKMFVPAPDNFKYVYYKFPALNLPAQIFWERHFLPGILDELKADLLFEPGNRGTLKSPCPKVSLIHNVGPFDDDFCRAEKFRPRLRLTLLKQATIQSIKASQGVIFISEFSRSIFSKYIDLEKLNSRIIYHGKVEPGEITPDSETLTRFGINKPYLLCVSDIRRYKKIYQMVQSYLFALERDASLPPLVIAGADHSPDYFGQIKKCIAESGRDDYINFTGQISRNEVLALYKNCHAFLFPSVLEACPNILIEALSSGCAIATSNRGVMPEIAHNAVIYFDPDNIDEFSSKIIEIAKDNDLRARLGKEAKVRARFFSWEKTARQTLDFLCGLAEPGQRNHSRNPKLMTVGK